MEHEEHVARGVSPQDLRRRHGYNRRSFEDSQGRGGGGSGGGEKEAWLQRGARMQHERQSPAVVLQRAYKRPQEHRDHRENKIEVGRGGEEEGFRGLLAQGNFVSEEEASRGRRPGIIVARILLSSVQPKRHHQRSTTAGKILAQGNF